jgi:uncharacterized membrane protein YfcA
MACDWAWQPHATTDSWAEVHVSLDIVVAGLIVGLLVGLTGSGGGALLTPILILLFGVTPSAAISNSIVASAVMRPIGGAIHFRKGTVHMGLVLWLSVGSVPAAFAGAFIEHALGSGKAVQQNLEYATGAAVMLAVIAMAIKMVMDATSQKNADDLAESDPEIEVKRVRTVVLGVFGGLLVGIISVGAGSLMIVLLMLLYPRLSMRRLVGTDIVQSIPLTLSAALGQALFGGLELGVTSAIVVGSIPGVIAGAWLSSRASNILLRPITAFVLAASALKLFGVGSMQLALTMGLIALVGLPVWAFIDGRGRPDAAWRAAGHQRRKTLSLVSLGTPVGVGFVTAAIYFARLRPRILRASADNPSLVPEPAYAAGAGPQA